MAWAKQLRRLYSCPPDPHSDAPLDPPGYAKRVQELEAEGLSTSDAQGVADVEFGQGTENHRG
jgi:hypothetical protein